jgi:hypothetical protein
LSLTSGTRLGVFELTALIGRGGMGEVYQARDTKLDRYVAIKILPEAVAHDTDRIARFQREAKTLASLNHPNIGAIYGLERSSGTLDLVMELVTGDDLSQRIARGAIPIDEALPIAKQIAEALEAAHEQGVIHRDLKPANIKVRSDGTVKVLDFGLAKAIESPNAMSPSVSQAPTITTPAMMTGVGMILGTAAYMSPEQARGKTVDKRADIWAFGAVLFEMLTGKRPFDGEDMTEVLGAVVRLEPRWDTLPSDVPLPVRTLLQSCLVKDPRRRVADMSIALFVLDKAAVLAAVPAVAPQTTALATASASRGRLAWMTAIAVVAGIAAIALAVPTLRHPRETPAPAPPETRLDIVTPATDQPTMFALSPDGRQIVFVASGDGVSRLWLRSLATTTAQPLAGTEGARFPFWSPDSRSIGFFAGGVLKRLDLGGGAPQTLVPVPSGGLGGTWNGDGVIVFASGLTTPLMRVAATGGAAVAVTALGSLLYFLPSFLPDGRRFLFSVAGGTDTTGIYVGTLEGSAPVRLTPANSAGVYLPSGWLLWVRTATLVAQRLDVEKAALTGAPVTVADGVAGAAFNASPISVAATGLMAYRTGTANQRQLTWIDRSGAARGTLGDSDENDLRHPRVSLDGSRVVVSRTVQGNTDLWLLDGARTSRLTFDAARDGYAVWSADGARIGFRSDRVSARVS